eukprot:1157301-Pelagomonas_calceolata.AAC.4
MDKRLFWQQPAGTFHGPPAHDGFLMDDVVASEKSALFCEGGTAPAASWAQNLGHYEELKPQHDPDAATSYLHAKVAQLHWHHGCIVSKMEV